MSSAEFVHSTVSAQIINVSVRMFRIVTAPVCLLWLIKHTDIDTGGQEKMPRQKDRRLKERKRMQKSKCFNTLHAG